MFEHSVKVPRHYKIAASIFKKVSTEGGSVKTLLYDNKLRHFRTNVLYALITETIKHADDINKIFENCCILMKEPRLDPWLAKILTSELLFGKKSLPGKSKPEQTILSYKEQFENYTADHQDDLKSEVTPRPRYVRINTNLLTTSDAVRHFQDEGYRFIRCTSGSYNDYLQQIQALTEDNFTQDYHVKTIFVFSPRAKFHEHELYLENKIILQDKATALAVHLLAPPSGSVALDMCAAPGMKTTQLAAFMRNEGKIYAVERNEKRYQTLCDFIEKTGSKCVQAIHEDALNIKRGDYDDVEYILLDPSCSGSGMALCVHNYIDPNRLAKLTSLQEKFLKHAMNAFPNAKRIIYSTCSLFPEENERVITNVVKTSRKKWRVQDVKQLLKGQWNNFGSGMYGSMGTRCLYAKPDTDLTTGFFLAVLDRDQKGLDKDNDNKVNDQQSERHKTKEESRAIESKNTSNSNETKRKLSEEFSPDLNEKNKAKMKKKKRQEENFIETEMHEIKLESDISEAQNGENSLDQYIEYKSENNEDINSLVKIKKKKKHKIKHETEAVVDENQVDVSSKAAKVHKEKRKQHISETKENYDYSELGIEESGQSDTKVKNKKHKIKFDIEAIVDVNEDEHSTKIAEVHKKKRKHLSETREGDDYLELQTNESGQTNTKRKKRKYRNKEDL